MNLKIAYIIPGLKHSGGIIHVLGEAREMKKRGHNITIFAPYAELNRFPYYIDFSKDFKFIHGISPDLSYLPSIRRPFHLINSLASIRKMAQALSQFLDTDTDITIADLYWMVFGAALSRKRGNKCKIVLKIQSPPQNELNSIVDWPFSFLCHRAVSKVDAITTVSRGAALSISEYFNREAVIIGNGVMDMFFEPAEESKKTELIRKLDIEGRKVILYVGRLNKGKGIEILLKVMTRLKQYNTLLLIAGGGEERKYYENMARNMGLCECIRWLGDISPLELPPIYQLADVFIFPSWFEGFGLPPLEAMASGVPVVLTDTEGAKEYARPGINCIMAKSGDIEAIFKGAVSILEDPGLRKRLGENGHETAKRFSWTNVADRAESLYNNLVRK